MTTQVFEATLFLTVLMFMLAAVFGVLAYKAGRQKLGEHTEKGEDTAAYGDGDDTNVY